MEPTTVHFILLLLAQAIVSLAMTIALVALALRGSRKLQDRLLFHSKALNRFAKYVLSDRYQTAMRDKARTAVLQELNADLAAQAHDLEAREQALQIVATELAEKQLLLKQGVVESAAAASKPGDQTTAVQGLAVQPTDSSALAVAVMADNPGMDETELAELEQELVAHQASAEGSALLAEIAELRANLDRQNAELARLRAQVSDDEVDATVNQLLEAQRKQLDQYQRMQRDMDMCVLVMEQELAQARENLQRLVVKLRQQTDRNRELAERLVQVSSTR